MECAGTAPLPCDKAQRQLGKKAFEERVGRRPQEEVGLGARGDGAGK